MRARSRLAVLARTILVALALALVGVPAPAAAAPAATSIVPGTANRSSLWVTATYDARVTLSTATRSLRGSVTIVATNESGVPIDRLELNTVMPRLGAMRLGTVTVDGTAVRATVEDQTILVPFGGVLPDGATATVTVAFSATLRRDLAGSNWMFTRANGIVDLYRWIPWVSRRTPFDRPNHGDPFVTPVSPSVRVSITTDVPLRIAGTGQRTAISGDRRTQVIEAANVRDLVLTAAADYRWLDAAVGDNIVRVAYRPGAPASAMLRAATRALQRMESLVGPYPYRVLTIAQSAGGYGMEGPGVAWIPTGVASGNLAYLVTHEVAHQWFYGLVGSDQAREPFADEAAADFLARYVLAMRRASRCSTNPLDRSIYRYGAACYYEVVYIQGGTLLDAARRRMGSTRFWATLAAYVADHRYGLVHTRTLLDALDAATPLDLRAWWRPRFPTLY